MLNYFVQQAAAQRLLAAQVEKLRRAGARVVVWSNTEVTVEERTENRYEIVSWILLLLFITLACCGIVDP